MLNYEKSPMHVIQVTTTDNGLPPLSFAKNFTVYLNNVNDRPHNIQLSKFTVPENASINYVIGSFSAVDEDPG